MGPFFTSRAEWRDLSPADERTYVRSGVGYVIRASLLGFGSFSLVAGAAEPYWRSGPVLLAFGASLAVGAGFAAFLFRREYRAARRVYGALTSAPAEQARDQGLTSR